MSNSATAHIALYQSHPVSLQVDANKVACVNHGPLTYQ